MASIVDPDPDDKSNSPNEFGPGHPNWPCPLCAGLSPNAVSPIIRAKHIQHTAFGAGLELPCGCLLVGPPSRVARFCGEHHR